MPWGLCLGLNVFCGIALAAGALTFASVAAVIGGRDWRVVGRACLVVGSIGYLVAMLGMIANEPTDNYWRTLVHGWTPRSILSGAVWTVLLLALLLFLEFLPQYSVSLARTRWFAILQRLDLPLLILAAILAVLHQFGLNRLVQLAETRFSPLWSGPSLSLMFYLSSLAMALAVLLFASWRSRLAFGKAAAILGFAGHRARAHGSGVRLSRPASDGLTAARAVLLHVQRQPRGTVALARNCRSSYWDDVDQRQRARTRRTVFWLCLIIAGVMANRLNTAITALEAGAGQNYLPRWGEFLIAYSLIAAGVAAFALGVKHMSVFAEPEIDAVA